MMNTAQHVSLYQRLLQYFQIAATVGQFIPEPHVRAITAILGVVTADLQNSDIGKTNAMLELNQALIEMHPLQVGAALFVAPGGREIDGGPARDPREESGPGTPTATGPGDFMKGGAD